MSLRLLSIALTIASLTGCAFADVEVHPPAHAAPKSAPGPGRGREVIVVAPFTDARFEQDRCGMQMNGFRMDTADVHCTTEPGRWLADALATRLMRDGYRVLAAEAVPGPSTIIVRGAVKKLFLEPHDGFFTRTVEGDFSVHLVVSSRSGLQAERTFYVKGSEEHIGSFESVFQAAATDATEQLENVMASAIRELVDRYPSLGAPGATSTVAMGGVR